MTQWWSKWQQRWLGADKKKTPYLLVGLGVVGMLWIGLSECLPDRRTEAAEATAVVSAAQIEQAMEQRITDLLDAVQGVGDCRVMVTLEQTEQTVYAADTTRSEEPDGSAASSDHYLTVDTDAGPVGLLLTKIQPTVRGVAVVCRGGGDPQVCQRVQQVIATALHISERRVCVVQQK